jgi:regulator of sigma E protease
MSLTDILQTLIYLVPSLSILVVAHEWGHFIVARMFGIRVDDFSVGFGKRIWRIGKLGNTEYNFRILPLGGFVKIHGMDPDEAPIVRAKDEIKSKLGDDPNAHEYPLIAENTMELVDEPGPDSYAGKPIWQRALVIFAGPLMSFLLGYVVFCLMGWVYAFPGPTTLNKVGEVQPGGEGQHIGLRTNDEIVAIDGQPITTGPQMIEKIHNSLGQKLTFAIRRDGKDMTLVGTPRGLTDEDGKKVVMPRVAGAMDLAPGIALMDGDIIDTVNDTVVNNATEAAGMLQKNAGQIVVIKLVRGMSPVTLRGTLPKPLSKLPAIKDFQPGVLNFNPASKWERMTFTQSVSNGNQLTKAFFTQFAGLFQHSERLKKSAGGIVAIYQMTNLAAKRGAANVVLLFASISLSLAVFNLFPIPVLDGGHLLALAIEGTRRRKLTAKQQQAMLLTGFAIILVLVIMISANDILRTVRGHIPQ